jgi:CBS domain-containing protein
MQTGVKVGDAMTQQPIMVSPGSSLQTCAKLMEKHKISAVLVKDKKEMGILTDKDIVRKMVATGRNPLSFKAKDVMTTVLHTAEPAHDVFEALMLMATHDVNHLPVVTNKNLHGILSVKDILKIQPHLFEILVDKFEIREQEQKLRALDVLHSETLDANDEVGQLIS